MNDSRSKSSQKLADDNVGDEKNVPRKLTKEAMTVFTALVTEHEQLAKAQQQQDEAWERIQRRMQPDVQCMVDDMERSRAPVDGKSVWSTSDNDDDDDTSTVNTAAESQARMIQDFERAQLSSIGESTEVLRDVLMQHKERILDEWREPEHMFVIQAEVWAQRCSICQIRGSGWRYHHWRDCHVHKGEREAAKSVECMIQQVWASGTEVGRKLEGICPGCKQEQATCWLVGRADSRLKPRCRLEAVVTDAVAVILGMDAPSVRNWEDREGGPRGSEKAQATLTRYGCRAVCRVWRTFGWLGSWDISRSTIDDFRKEYYSMWCEVARNAGLKID